MPAVETVRGSVDSAELGRTYMHEHIFVLTTDVQLNYPDEWGDEQARIDDAVRKLDALAAQAEPPIGYTALRGRMLPAWLRRRLWSSWVALASSDHAYASCGRRAIHT